MQIHYEVHGDEQLKGKLSRFSEYASDWTECWDVIQADFYKIENDLFDSGGATGSKGSWQPLSEKYAKWKNKNHPGKQILELSGSLRYSLTHDDGAGSVAVKLPTEMRLGTTIPYAFYHYKGKGVPMRRPIDLNNEDRSRWMKLTQEWLVKQKKKAGLSGSEIGI